MPPRTLIGRRPTAGMGVERWVQSGSEPMQDGETTLRHHYGARLTVDVSHELRGRIKIAAFKQGFTVANLVRQILQREFGDDSDRT